MCNHGEQYTERQTKYLHVFSFYEAVNVFYRLCLPAAEPGIEEESL